MPAPPRALHEIAREAELLLAVQGEVPGALVRELLSWVALRPSPSEEARGATADYVVLPVTLQAVQAALTNTPQGAVIVFGFQLVVPAANFNAVGRIMGAGGQAPNPAEGMLPIIEARFVVPRRRVAQRVLDEVFPRVLLRGG